MRYLFVLILALSTGCATAFQVGNTYWGGSFLCGSTDTSSQGDSRNFTVDGCLEETLHGADR